MGRMGGKGEGGTASASADARRRPSMDGLDTSSEEDRNSDRQSDDGLRKPGDVVVADAEAGHHDPTLWERLQSTYVAFCYDRPVLWLVVLLGIGVCLSGVGYTFFGNTKQTDTEWLITSDKYTARMDAYKEVNAALAKEATPDPGKLRSALEGLRTALRAAKQTNSGPERYLLAKTSEDPAERAAAAAMRRLDRPTQAARAKTLPRRLGPGGLFEAPPLAAEMGPGRAAGAGRGAPHDVSFKAVLGRQDAAARMLSSIEADLDAMVNRRGLQGE